MRGIHGGIHLRLSSEAGEQVTSIGLATSSQFWMNLQPAWALWHVKHAVAGGGKGPPLKISLEDTER